MELLLILILICLAIIIPIKIFKPTLILLSGLATLIGTINLPFISSISGDTITYATLDPLFQWALGLILLVTSIILYLDLLKVNNNESD